MSSVFRYRVAMFYSQFPLAQAGPAFEYVRARRGSGAVIVTMN